MKKLLILILFVVINAPGYSQYSFNGSSSGAITISSVMNISISSGSVTTINTTSQYNSGVTISNYATVSIKSNLPWTATYKSNAANFTALSGGTGTMPCSIVGFRLNGSGSFKTLSTTSQTITSGSAGNTSTSGNTFNIDLNYNPGFSYPGGIYSLSVIFTITAS